MTASGNPLDLASRFSDAVASLVERAAPSVVRLECDGVAVTGTVWGDDLVVASHHALDRDAGIVVHTGASQPEGRPATGTVVGRDLATDVAVVRVEGAPALPALPNATGTGRVGELAIALGRSATGIRAAMGMVGGVDEPVKTGCGALTGKYILLDSPVAPGFSGGPLLDLDGHLLAVSSAGVRRGTVGVPARAVERAVHDVLGGRPRRPALGVGVYPVRIPRVFAQDSGQRTGVLLVSVDQGSPAQSAGLTLGDIIVALDGQPVAGPAELSALLVSRMGSPVMIRLVRCGRVEDVLVTTGGDA